MLGRWRQHGRLLRFYGALSLRMMGLKGWSTEEEVRAVVAEMRIVALRPAVAADSGALAGGAPTEERLRRAHGVKRVEQTSEAAKQQVEVNSGS